MGLYLAIGLMTELKFKKNRAEKLFGSVEEPIRQLQEFYAPADAYDRRDSEDYVSLVLKEELLAEGLPDFLRDFYNDRYAFVKKKDTKAIEEAVEKVSACKTAEEVLELANRKELYRFQMDNYWFPIYLRDKWDDTLDVLVEGIDLSIDGKILMECDNYLWEYMIALMRKSLERHKVAQAIYMTISG